jgi:hypothetical protein
MNNKYNVWNKWDKLKTVMLGDVYRPEFYDGIKSPEIKDGLKQIADESMEDLEHFSNILKDFGCEVLRPKMDPNERIEDYMQDGKMRGIVPRPPLMPRDSQFVQGNNLIYTDTEYTSHIEDVLTEYNDDDVVSIRLDELMNRDCRGRTSWAPNFTGVGKDVYVDILDYRPTTRIKRILQKANPDIRLNYLRHGGHSDAVFHTIKPGAIISLEEVQAYGKTFPDWDVLYLPDQSWNLVHPFITMKKKNNGKWWIPGQENNDELTFFIESWLSDWVGFVEETVFDVNVLVLDEHHVAMTNVDNPKINAFLKKHNMEAIHVPWRHRYFHDGGLHCLTLDLYREGKMEDYFPDRPKRGLIDYGPASAAGKQYADRKQGARLPKDVNGN